MFLNPIIVSLYFGFIISKKKENMSVPFVWFNFSSHMSHSHTLALSTFHSGVDVSKSAVYIDLYLDKSNDILSSLYFEE